MGLENERRVVQMPGGWQSVHAEKVYLHAQSNSQQDRSGSLDVVDFNV